MNRDRDDIDAPALEDHPPDAPLRVLVVEDDERVRESLVSVLTGARHDVITATDGGDAVRSIRRAPPDVVLMDLDLPTMDGWDAIECIRREHGRRRPYIIVLSGLSDARSRQLAFDAGCDEYVVKPCDIRAALRAFVHRRRRPRGSVGRA